MDNNLLETKYLFKKLASASVWCRTHQVTEQALVLIGQYYEALELLGVDRQFSKAVFVFGITAEVAYQSWIGEGKREGISRPSKPGLAV